MERYHNKVHFPQEHLKDLEILNKELNNKSWSFSSHCLENIKYRAIDMKNLLNYINQLSLNEKWIFEYYVENNEISKVCYRISYDLYDFILVLSNQKKIVTIYVNSKNDMHETLRKEVYTR